MKVYFASQNKNKISEIQSLVPGEFEITGIDGITQEELEETGDTLEENAMQKARFVARKTNAPAFADDTGLEVEALSGAPGVISARYAGPARDANDNMAKVLAELRHHTNRNAQFRTVIAYVNGETEFLFEGVVKGSIAEAPTGTSGFGYDPVFIPEGESRTFAEMSLEEKNAVSHRAKAVRAFVAWLMEQ